MIKIMQKVTVKISEDTLLAVNTLFKSVITAIPENREQRKNKSIADMVLAKLLKKQIDRTNKDGDFNIKLEVHEAIVLDELLRPNLNNCNTAYQHVLIRKTIDELHQKTA